MPFAMSSLRLVYKHSPTCSLCHVAEREIAAFRAMHAEPPVAQLDVFSDREACQAIERDTGVRHESPQVLLYDGDRVVWHASHRRVTAAAVTEAVAAARQGSATTG
jgi:bacillithiol system protein YtxJ